MTSSITQEIQKTLGQIYWIITYSLHYSTYIIYSETIVDIHMKCHRMIE